MSPRFVASLFLLLGFPGAQPLPSGPPIPAPINRLLREGRDQALRVVRARACDAGG